MNTINIAARILNFTLMFAMPFGLAVFLVRKYRTAWRLFGIGVITFLLSQAVHIPFNSWVLDPWVESWGLDLQSTLHLAAYGLVYGLSAGVFEEITRYLGFRLWIRQERSWSSALMYGAGHGGIESIILGGIVLYAFVQAVTLRGADLSTVVDADQVALAQAQLEAYWAVPWHLAILGAVERLATIVFHLSATVLVLQSFTRRNILWLILAVSWHTLVDAASVFASQTWNPYVTEAIILGFGLISLGILFALRSQGEDNEPGETVGGTPPGEVDLEIKPLPLSEESLEDSRYM
jgi:uncharacterized membrane protein YhfC